MTTIEESLETIWDVLHIHRERTIPEQTDSSYDDQWDSICESMAHITESLGLELNHDGDYVTVTSKDL